MKRLAIRPPSILAISLALLAASLLPAQAKPLGRLFATPAERDAMEGQRGSINAPAPVNMPPPEVQAALPDPNQPAPPASAPVAAASVALVMSGSLRSSSGRSTVWLNNVPQNDSQNRFTNKTANTVTVTLPSGKRVVLKPGQRYDLDAARVKDINEP